MREGRRTFLWKAAAGVAAVAGLLSPARALAWRRRRAACVPCYPVPPPCEAPVRIVGVASERAPMTILYPDEYEVPGGGGFVAWGKSDVGIMGFSATCGGVNGVAMIPPAAEAGAPANTWAFSFGGLARNTDVTLTVYYMDPRLGKTAAQTKTVKPV